SLAAADLAVSSVDFRVVRSFSISFRSAAESLVFGAVFSAASAVWMAVSAAVIAASESVFACALLVPAASAAFAAPSLGWAGGSVGLVVFLHPLSVPSADLAPRRRHRLFRGLGLGRGPGVGVRLPGAIHLRLCSVHFVLRRLGASDHRAQDQDSQGEKR